MCIFWSKPLVSAKVDLTHRTLGWGGGYGTLSSVVQLMKSCLDDLLILFHRRTHASYVYNGCLAWYNVELTPRIHSSVKFVGLPLATRATVE